MPIFMLGLVAVPWVASAVGRLISSGLKLNRPSSSSLNPTEPGVSPRSPPDEAVARSRDAGGRPPGRRETRPREEEQDGASERGPAPTLLSSLPAHAAVNVDRSVMTPGEAESVFTSARTFLRHPATIASSSNAIRARIAADFTKTRREDNGHGFSPFHSHGFDRETSSLPVAGINTDAADHMFPVQKSGKNRTRQQINEKKTTKQ